VETCSSQYPIWESFVVWGWYPKLMNVEVNWYAVYIFLGLGSKPWLIILHWHRGTPRVTTASQSTLDLISFDHEFKWCTIWKVANYCNWFTNIFSNVWTLIKWTKYDCDYHYNHLDIRFGFLHDKRQNLWFLLSHWSIHHWVDISTTGLVSDVDFAGFPLGWYCSRPELQLTISENDDVFN